MALPWFIYLILALPIVASFAEPIVEKRLKDLPKAKVLWGFFVRISWGLLAWFWGLILISSILQKFFAPNQSAYIFSGSAITVWPAIGLAAIISWLVLGPEVGGADAKPYSSFEKRSDALVGLSLRIGKWLALIALAFLGLLLALWFTDNLKEAVETMTTGQAIIAGSAIISLTIYLGLNQRK